METSGWIQFAIYLIALALVTKPMGLYLMHVLDPNGKTWLDPVLAPVERFTYRAMGVDARKEHDWKQYTLAMLLFSLVGCLFTYAILRLQYFLPLNPQKLAGVSPDLSFNTATSFTTNTNWQNYAGESTMSYFSQMVGLAFHNFVSAATGITIAAALVRAIARHSATTLGNFWVDLVRVTYYLLLPICLVFAVFLVSQGMIQNFKPYTKATLVEPMKTQVEKKNDKGETIKGPDGKAVTKQQTVTDQNIVQGPMASQVAIKMLGTNGGGYVNANAAHPFENPTPLSNFIQMLSIFSIGSGLTYYLGRMVKNQKHGWTVWTAMLILFVGGVLLCWWAEANGNPIHQSLGVAGGNMEGKEVRFGIFNSALFATVTTDASCGAVNSMHDSFTALGGFVPLFNIQLGEVIFGGVGAGLYGMLVFVVLAVDRRPEIVRPEPAGAGLRDQSWIVELQGRKPARIHWTVGMDSDGRRRHSGSDENGAHLVQRLGRSGRIPRPRRQVDEDSPGRLASPGVGEGEHVRALLAIESAAIAADEQFDRARTLLDGDIVAEPVVDVSWRDRLPTGGTAGNGHGAGKNRQRAGDDPELLDLRSGRVHRLFPRAVVSRE